MGFGLNQVNNLEKQNHSGLEEPGCDRNKPYASDVWVYNKLIGKRRKAPIMMVARKNPLTCSLDGKLYM